MLLLLLHLLGVGTVRVLPPTHALVASIIFVLLDTLMLSLRLIRELSHRLRLGLELRLILLWLESRLIIGVCGLAATTQALEETFLL